VPNKIGKDAHAVALVTIHRGRHECRDIPGGNHVNEPPRRRSAAERWAPLARFVATDERIADCAGKRRTRQFFYEFARFGLKQGWSCLFGGAMVGLLIATSLFYPHGAPLARYDFLFLAALAIQAAMLALRLETADEAKVIAAFHVVGTVMEIFKTGVGSWIYPEPALFHIGGVPLFSGFMYAAIGSYIARAWRLFDFRFVRHPPLWTLSLVSVAIYANFYLHHYFVDVRPVLFAALALLCGRTVICYRIHRHYRRMPLLLGLFLVSVFIFIAENLGTLTRTWIYPSQLGGWTMVPLGKLGSWFLLMTISYVMVAWVNGPRAAETDAGTAIRVGDRRLTPASSTTTATSGAALPNARQPPVGIDCDRGTEPPGCG